jgi:hypothetical protein
VVEGFGALFSFICLMIAVIRLGGIYRYDPVCGIYECEFRNRLVAVAVNKISKIIKINILSGTLLHQHSVVRWFDSAFDAELRVFPCY